MLPLASPGAPGCNLHSVNGPRLARAVFRKLNLRTFPMVLRNVVL